MTRTLDFMIIGTQKGGTTSLWQYLRHHPSVAMPERKEEPFFSTRDAKRPGALPEFIEAHFGDAPPGVLLGKATPQYMTGSEEADVEEIARRIFAAAPGIRLLVLLRDPIERAMSNYTMSVRRGIEQRSFDVAADALLAADQLVAGRTRPTETNSYVVRGEYGRILAAYREHIPAEQIHVEMTESLGRDPGAVLDRVLGMLGLPVDYRPRDLGTRFHRGGARKLLDDDAQACLFDFMREHIWPRMGDDAEHVKRLFRAFYEVWNVAPDEYPQPISAAIRDRLQAHYEADAALLAKLGVPAPWVDAWHASALS